MKSSFSNPIFTAPSNNFEAERSPFTGFTAKDMSFMGLYFKKFFTIILLSLVGLVAFGSDYQFSVVSLSDGLSNPNVKCVLRDSKDYIWIGTKGGLNKFDKGKMTTYKRNTSNLNTLPDNDIVEIFEDAKGTVWVVCTTGVVAYDRKNDTFIPVNVEGKTLRARSHLLLPTGVVLGGAGVLFFYDYESGKISEKPTTGGSDKYYTAIHPWTRDRYLLATRWDGMWIYNTKTGEIEPSSIVKGKRVINSFIDSDGDVWISEYGNGISHLDRTGKVLPIYLEGLETNGIVLDIMENEGEMIFATDGLGIISYNKSSGKTHKIDSDVDAPSILRSVNCLYKDNYNYLYAGTVRGGLVVLSQTPMKTINLTPDLEAFTITSIVTDRNKVWLGIDGNGLMLFEPDNLNKVMHVAESRGLKVVSMDNFDDNRLLVSTYDSGLFLFDKITGKLSEVPQWMQKISEEYKSSGIPLDIKRISGDRVALITDKIFISDLNGGRVAVIETGLTPERIRVFYSDIGSMLCYTEQEVFAVDLTEENISSLFKLKNNIECAAYDGDRFVYAGTSSGVKRYDFENGKVDDAEPNSRMPNGSGITALAINDDKLWIGGLGKLFVRDLKKGGIYGFGPADGVQPNEFIYKAVATTPNYLLLGGVNGLLKINVNELESYDLRASRIPLKLTEVLIDGMVPVEVNKNLSKLPDNYSTVKLRFSGGNPNPVKADPIRIFIGEKKTGSVIETTDNTLTLGHLQASSGGRYNIYASQRDVDGKWTEPNYVGAIIVPVAWWRKPIAIVIICLLGAAALIMCGIYLYSRRRNKIKNRMEARRRQSLEREVGFLMNLNYELRTPLTLIYSRLKLLTDSVSKGKVPEEKVIAELDNIYRSTGKMRDIINTTVELWQSGDIKTGDKLEKINVAEWIQEVAEDLKNLAQEKKITINTSGLNSNLEITCDVKRATIALHNVIRSAISHAAEKTVINIETSNDEENIKILFTFFNDESHGAGEEFRYADHLMALMDGELTYTRNNTGEPSIIVMKFPKEFKRQSDAESSTLNSESKPETADVIEIEDANDENAGFDLSNLTAIVVEDDPELRELLVSALSSDFKKVLEASNGKDALTYIKNSNPDLIITEARLPQMTGIELCRIIKKTKEYSHIPVIMLTTLLEEKNIANGNNYGADNYLTKPFDINVLEKRCVTVLRSFDRVKQWYKSQASDILPTDKRHSNDAEAFVLKVRDIIEQNIGVTGFGVDDIVNKMLVSRSTLYSRFKELTGQSLGNYINEFKVGKAKEMLSTTNMTMVEIADALGFTTQRYFSTFFKEKTGMTPTAFRESVMEGASNAPHGAA